MSDADCMKQFLACTALAALLSAPAFASDIFEIAAANRASGAMNAPKTVPYLHTVDVTVSGRKGDEVREPVTARLRIDPSQPQGSRVTILSRTNEDVKDMNKALEDVIEQIEENEPEEQAEGFWCSARDSDEFPVTPENFTVLGEENGTTRLKPVPDRMVQLMMGEDDLDDLPGRERSIAKKMGDRLEGEIHLNSSNAQLQAMRFEITRPVTIMLIAKIKEMAMEVDCDPAPNGYPYVSRFFMHVEGGAFGFDMVSDVELHISDLTPIDAVSEEAMPESTAP